MRKFKSILIFIFLIITLTNNAYNLDIHHMYAEYKDIDSLIAFTRNLSLSKEKVDNEIEIGVRIAQTELDSGFQYIISAKEYARVLNYKEAIALSSMAEAFYYSRKGEYQKSIGLYEEVIDFVKTNNLPYYEALAYIYKAINSIHKFDYKNAAFDYNKSLEISIENNFTEVLSQTYNLYGTLLNSLSRYDLSREYYLKALTISREGKSRVFEIYSLRNLVSYYYSSRNADSCKMYLDTLKSLVYNSKFINEKIEYYRQAGNYYLDLEDNFQLAIKNYKKGADIAKDYNYDIKYSNILTNLSHSFALANNFDSTLYYSYEALRIRKKIGIKNYIGHAYRNLSSDYMHFEKYEIALNYIDSAITVFKDARIEVNLSKSLLMKKNILIKLGKPLESIDVFNQYVALNEKIHKDAKLTEIKSQEEAFDLRTVERNLEKSNVRLDYLTNILLWVILISISILAIILLYMYFQKRKDNLQLQKKQLELEHTLSELHQRNIEIDKLNSELEEKVMLRTKQLNDEIEVKSQIEKSLIKSQKELAIALDNEKNLSYMKSNFISIVSHEYRNPLTIIRNSEELIRFSVSAFKEKKIQLDKLVDNLEQYGSKIESNIINLIDLMNDILWYSKTLDKRIELNLSTFNLYEFLCERAKRNLEFDEYGHIINISQNNDIEEITSDKKILLLIVDNIISNALKYSEESTKIEINYKSFNSNQISISINDEGIGIDKEDLSLIFEPFNRARNVGSVSGSGLGLSIVKSMVELLNGEVHIESELNKGTNITITIPDAKDKNYTNISSAKDKVISQ